MAAPANWDRFPDPPHRTRWEAGAIRPPAATQNDVQSAILQTATALGRAAILLDRRGEIVAVNPPAQALLGDGLVDSQNRLRASNRRADVPLQDLLKRACWCEEADDAVLQPVALPCRSGRPLIVWASLVPGELQSAKVLLILNALEPPEPPAEATLAEVFGLTSSEARLAREICRGQGLPAAAETLGVSVNTVRTHLKGVFGKTGAHSQSQLASLLSQLGSGPARQSRRRVAAPERRAFHP